MYIPWLFASLLSMDFRFICITFHIGRNTFKWQNLRAVKLWVTVSPFGSSMILQVKCKFSLLEVNVIIVWNHRSHGEGWGSRRKLAWPRNSPYSFSRLQKTGSCCDVDEVSWRCIGKVNHNLLINCNEILYRLAFVTYIFI